MRAMSHASHHQKEKRSGQLLSMTGCAEGCVRHTSTILENLRNSRL